MFQKGVKLCPLTDEEQEGLIVLNVLGNSPVAASSIVSAKRCSVPHKREKVEMPAY